MRAEEEESERPPTERELRLTACLYARHGVAEYLRAHGRLPETVGGSWSFIPLRLVVEERGFDPTLTEDERMILEAIAREDRLPGLVVCVVDDGVAPMAFARFGEHITVAGQTIPRADDSAPASGEAKLRPGRTSARGTSRVGDGR